MNQKFAYREEVLAALGRHGLRPTAATAPARVREALLELYKYEIKVLRAQVVDGRIERGALCGPRPDAAQALLAAVAARRRVGRQRLTRTRGKVPRPPATRGAIGNGAGLLELLIARSVGGFCVASERSEASHANGASRRSGSQESV